MTTYNSYEAAKIVNPESEIYVSISGFFADSDHVSCIALSGVNEGWNKCNPADYCMTVEKFLADGHKFVKGDVVISHDGVVVFMTMKIMADAMNTKSRVDCNNHVLRAAALEEKPFLQAGEEFAHTKALNFIYERMAMFGESANLDYMHKFKSAIAFTERAESEIGKYGSINSTRKMEDDYLKSSAEYLSRVEVSILDGIWKGKPKHVKIEHVKIKSVFELDKELMHEGDYGWKSESGEFHPSFNEVEVIGNLTRNSLYRKIETEIDERQEFIDEVKGILRCGYCDDDIGAMFDSGCRFND